MEGGCGARGKGGILKYVAGCRRWARTGWAGVSALLVLDEAQRALVRRFRCEQSPEGIKNDLMVVLALHAINLTLDVNN